MSFLHELRARVLDYVESKENLLALREWFAPRALDLAVDAEPDLKRMVYSMQRSLADHAEGYISETALKQNLFASLFPSPSQSLYQVFGVAALGAPVVVSGTLVPSAEYPSASFVGVGPVEVHA